MLKLDYFQLEQHYPILLEWWKHYNHLILMPESLGHGLVILKENDPICMSFVYSLENTDLAQIGWTIAKPNNNRKDNYLAIDLLMEGSMILAKKLNKKILLNFTSSHGISKILESKNFIHCGYHHLVIGGL